MSHSLPHWEVLGQFDEDLLAKIEPVRDTILGEGALSLRDKELAMLSMVMMLRFEPGIRLHFGRALDMGISEQELFELCMVLMLVSGVPTFRLSLLALKEIVDERAAAAAQ